jgi:hypothetical protein
MTQAANNRATYRFPTEYTKYAWCDIQVIIERNVNQRGFEEGNSYVLLTIGEMDEKTGRRKPDSKKTVSLTLAEIVNLKQIIDALNYGKETAENVMKNIFGKMVKNNNRGEPCVSFFHKNPRTNKGTTITACLTNDNGIRISIQPYEESDINLFYSFKFGPDRKNILKAYLEKAIDLILSNSY